MSAQLSIERLNATYLIPRGLLEREAGEARHRLDAAMRHRLADMCHRMLERVLDTGDASVWLIRKLDLDMTLDVGAVDEETLTRVWASRIAASLARTFARGADGETVMRFPDRAAFLAHFLRDLADGRAWEKWYYNSLDTLRSLPASAAMREALIREPEQMKQALLHLARRSWLEQSLSVMSEGDAQRLYKACVGAEASADSEAGERKTVQALLAVWQTAHVRASAGSVANAHNALRLYLALRIKSAGASDGATQRIINHLLGFAEILRRMSDPEAFLSALTRGKLAEAIELAREGGATLHLESLPFIQRLAAQDKDWLSHAAQTLSANTPATISKEKAAAARRIVNSSCGGLFLLLPAMQALDLNALIEAAPYPDSEETDKAQALRYLLFLKCCRARSLETAYDFVPRFLAGFDELPSFEKLQELSLAATAEMDRASLWLLLEALILRGRVEGIHLAAELIATAESDGEDVLLLTDITSDAWAFASYVTQAQTAQDVLERGLKTIRQATGNAAASLLMDRNLDALIEAQTLAGHLSRVTDSEQMREMLTAHGTETEERPRLWTDAKTQQGEQTESFESLSKMLSQYLSHRRPAASELAYFSLLNFEPLKIESRGFDLAWSLVARALMKEFAARLVNFSWSSAEYLSRNFLEGMSIVQLEGGQVEVKLARAPLHIMLRIAGMDEQSYTISWLNETQVTLSLMPE